VKDGLIIGALSIVPRRRVSRLMGWSSRRRIPRAVLRAFLRWYVRHYGVNLDEVEGGLADYRTLAAFFTRPLKDGARPQADAAGAVTSPADGRVHAVGRVLGGRLPQSPDLDFAVRDLLAGDGRFDDGEYAVIYLSPKDYHRVHAPLVGDLTGYRYRPGRLWPVFPAATRRIRDLFSRNERLVMQLRSEELGDVAMVMVGAFGVGRMTASFAELVTNTGRPAADRDLDQPLPLLHGDELGRFELGSTVVLVFEAGRVAWDVEVGVDVKVGQLLAHATGDPGA
jgi:phosphatidylserine decarboxylase